MQVVIMKTFLSCLVLGCVVLLAVLAAVRRDAQVLTPVASETPSRVDHPAPVTTTTTIHRAPGTTRYVSTEGSDRNPGTLARPFQTLNHAVRALHPGDTLYV